MCPKSPDCKYASSHYSILDFDSFSDFFKKTRDIFLYYFLMLCSICWYHFSSTIQGGMSQIFFQKKNPKKTEKSKRVVDCKLRYSRENRCKPNLYTVWAERIWDWSSLKKLLRKSKFCIKILTGIRVFAKKHLTEANLVRPITIVLKQIC